MIEFYKTSDYLNADTVPLRIMRFDPQMPCAPHQHQFFELVVITGGKGLHIVQEEQYNVSAGDVYVIKPDSWHEYRDVQRLSLVNILYEPNALKMHKWDVRSLPGYHALFKLEPEYRHRHKFSSKLRLNSCQLSHLKNLLVKLEKEITEQPPGYGLMATSIFMEIVAFVSRCYNNVAKDSSKELLRIGQAINHIDENCTKQIDLNTLAKIAHMSKRNFQRVFHEAMEVSPIEYLIQKRIAKAMELLSNHKISIIQIAYQTGFNDSNYFTRQFRKIVGITPRQFRASTGIQPPYHYHPTQSVCPKEHL
jgi:AraC-like DNA-binding protein/quercetin dioxygenase-like cupin family protein